jgi:hypothetical protein
MILAAGIGPAMVPSFVRGPYYLGKRAHCRFPSREQRWQCLWMMVTLWRLGHWHSKQRGWQCLLMMVTPWRLGRWQSKLLAISMPTNGAQMKFRPWWRWYIHQPSFLGRQTPLAGISSFPRITT